MLESCIRQIEEEVVRLESRIAVLRECWNDLVSVHVEQTYIDALADSCNNFCSEAGTTEESLRRCEETLRQLADRY